MTPAPRRTLARTVLIAVALLAAAAGSATGLLIAQASGSDTGAVPAEESVDVGFSRDMREHHAQAVQMSTLVRDATTDSEVRTLALDILLTQQQQAGQMYGWLSMWNLPQSAGGAPMQWAKDAMPAAEGPETAGMPTHQEGTPTPVTTSPMPMPPTAAMPGMASAADLQRLARLKGPAAERLYLQLMIPHHQGGVAMATVAAAQATRPQVRNLARSIVQSQTAELTVLQRMLTARGGPLPPG